MREIAKLAAILFVICAIAAGALAGTNALTYDKIEAINAENAAKARQNVMSSADDITEKIEDSKVEEIAGKLGITTDVLNEIYVAKSGGEVVGYTIKCTNGGFGGGIGVLTGIDSEGNVTGVAVLSHAETPGLGANATNESWISQYNGKSINSPINVIKSGTAGQSDIVAITGATITSKAVTGAVNYAGQAYLELVGGNK